MLGPYYRFQLTSVLSILHRLTGIYLALVAAPLALWWLIALGQGAEAFSAMQACMAGILGQLAFLGTLFCLSYHLLNGIRHLVWDTGRGLEIRSAYASGWLVVAGSFILTAVLAVVTL